MSTKVVLKKSFTTVGYGERTKRF